MAINKGIGSPRVLADVDNLHQGRSRTVRITNLVQGWSNWGLIGLYSKVIRLRRITAILLRIELMSAYC